LVHEAHPFGLELTEVAFDILALAGICHRHASQKFFDQIAEVLVGAIEVGSLGIFSQPESVTYEDDQSGV